MKIALAKILPLCLVTLPFVYASAQDMPIDRSLKDHCVSWVKSVRPSNDIDAADFCSGVIQRNENGWWTIRKCGTQPDTASKPAPKYCASSSLILQGETWAAGFSSETIDGRDLLNGGTDANRKHAVFYSRTGFSIGDLTLPAGIYSLLPSNSPTGWTLKVTEQGENADDGQRTLREFGTIAMKQAHPSDRVGSSRNLTVLAQPWSDQCPGPSKDFHARELHFIYGETDLFVCVRPDQVPAVDSASR
jgi:hypothetical protein